MRLLAALISCLLLVLAGCEGRADTASRFQPRDSAGIAVWSLGGETRPLGFSLEKVGELVLPDSGWAVAPDGVAVDALGGRIYVLDEMGPRLLAFTLEGVLVGEIGNPGEGPGEFTGPVAVDEGPEGIVTLVDARRSLLLSWDRTGAFLGQERLPEPYWGPGLEVTEGGVAFVRADHDGDAGSLTEVLVSFTGAAPSELMTLRQEWAPVESPCGTMPAPRVMTPSIVWGGNDRYLAASEWPEYSLRVFEGESLVAVLRRSVPPRRVTEEEAERWVERGPMRFFVDACGMGVAEVIRTLGHPLRASLSRGFPLQRPVPIGFPGGMGFGGGDLAGGGGMRGPGPGCPSSGGWLVSRRGPIPETRRGIGLPSGRMSS